MPSFISTACTILAVSSAVIAAPLQPRQADQASIALQAGGGPPNGPAPKNISDNATADFQAVNFLENMESAFFEAGLANLTAWNNERKYGKLDAAIEVVRAVHAQELVHVQTAENILKANNKPTFDPCKYTFPVSTPKEFLKLADIITTVGIGGVINVASGLALTDPTLVPGPASILATEARHDAFFRQVGSHLIPNPAPFDTRLSAGFALNLANPFIVPGSCAAQPKFALIPPMSANVDAKTTGSSGKISFTFSSTQVKSTAYANQTLFIGWVNQANKIAYTTATVGSPKSDGTVEVGSTIPEGLAGIAFAALTAQSAAPDVNTLTGLTIAGPAPVRIS